MYLSIILTFLFRISFKLISVSTYYYLCIILYCNERALNVLCIINVQINKQNLISEPYNFAIHVHGDIPEVSEASLDQLR